MILACCLLLPAAPAVAAGFHWDAAAGLSGWTGLNVSSLQPTADGIHAVSFPETRFFILSHPVDTTDAAAQVAVRLKTMSMTTSVICSLRCQNRVVATTTLPLYSGPGWKELLFDMGASLQKGAQVDNIALGFAFMDSVDIAAVSFRDYSAFDLFAPRGMQAHEVNGLFPFRVYGHSLTVIGAASAGIAALGIAIFFSMTGRRGIREALCVVVLAFYFLLDGREAYEQYSIMQALQQNYLSPPREEKRYVWADNLVQFADFVRRNAEPGEKAIRIFSSDYRSGYLRYLLYPLRVEQDRESFGAVNVFSETDDFHLEGNNLLFKDQVLFRTGKGIPYDSRSFLYVMP